MNSSEVYKLQDNPCQVFPLQIHVLYVFLPSLYRAYLTAELVLPSFGVARIGPSAGNTLSIGKVVRCYLDLSLVITLECNYFVSLKESVAVSINICP